MMVKVYNDNVHPYSEKFKDQKLEIPPHEFIEMEYEEAVQFLGTYSPIKVDADENPIPQCYKMLRIVKPVIKATPGVANFNCQKCGYKGANNKDLGEHLDATHADEELVKLEELDEYLAKNPGKK